MRPTILAVCAAFIMFWSTLLAAEVQAAPREEETSSPSRALEAGDEPAAGSDVSSAKAEGKLVIHKRVWDASSKKWKPATPAHSWTFQVADDDGKVVAEPTDEDNTPLAAGSYTVTEKSSPPNPAGYTLVDFIKNANGGSNCPDKPKGDNQSVSIEKDDFGSKGEGTIHLCAYNQANEPEAAPTAVPSTATPTKAAKPKSVKPILECVTDNGGGAYTAFFGFKNDNKDAVTIPAGEENSLTPGAGDSALPTVFQPGRTPAFPNAAFAVAFDGEPLVWTLKGPNGKTSKATASESSKSCAKPKLIMEFVSESAESVAWRLRPSFDADLVVWDEKAESCTAFGGAACDSIASGGSGKFNSTGSGQYIEVTQSYEVKDGKKCEVKNTAEYATGPFDEPAEPEDKVSARYECSGASAMGWPLLGVGFAAAVVAAWVWRRKRA